MTCTKCEHGTARRFGYFGKRRIQRWRCNSCKATFCEAAPKLGTHYTDPDTAAKALSLMLEGMSVRAIPRLTGLHKATILALMNTAAENARRVLDTRLRGINARYVQSDEIWCFVGKKRRNVREYDPAEVGDQWVFVAMDAETKLVPSFVIGKRTKETTLAFLRDLQGRLAHARFQLTTDGFHVYERGVEDVFGGTVDFAQLVKLFGDYGQHGDERYSPPRITEVISKVRDGRPDPAHISTSHIERQNLTMRMQLTPTHERFQQKAPQSKSCCHSLFCLVQFLSSSPDTESDPGDAGCIDGSRLVPARVARLGASHVVVVNSSKHSRSSVLSALSTPNCAPIPHA